MRIIAGDYKGRKIFEPLDKETRPLKDLTKESIFNILEHSKNVNVPIKKSCILDIFSGTGSFGLECISRGALKVYFIEKYKPSIKILKKNIPFRSFEIKKRDEKTLGELFCFFILETILIGKALNLNPYDQPAVELIKKETQKLLVGNKR